MNWNAWTGIGTIALAVMTLAAVVTSIVLARQDRRRFEDERRHSLEQEQLTEASSVQVNMTQNLWQDKGQRRLLLTVSNQGRFTIIHLEARFCTDGRTVVAPVGSDRDLPAEYQGKKVMGLIREEGAMAGILRGLGEGMRFGSDPLSLEQLKDPYVLVRWTDRWGTRWEHRLGQVRRIEGGDTAWTP